MFDPTNYPLRAVPARVLAFSGAALAVPVLAALFFSDSLGEYRPMLWLLALIPAFRMAYYGGWRGVVLASAVVMTALVLSEVVASPGDPALRNSRMLFTVVVFYLAIALGIAMLAKKLADALEVSRQADKLRRLEKAVETMHLGVTVSDAEGRICYVNAADAAKHGYTAEELLGQPSSIYAPPARRTRASAPDLSGISSWKRERSDVRKDGTLFPVELQSDVVMGADGRPIGVVTVCEDITERKRAEGEAGRMGEHQRSLQRQLNQAQKMEAVGRLAGGVAHDFNNILTVILAEAQMSLMELPEPEPSRSSGKRSLRDSLQEILEAGNRATGLTRQLLAFSRKQLLEPTVFGLNDVLAGMEKLVRRLVGEDVEVVVRAAASPSWVRAERGQIEQVVLNLAVNARDAMPQGGRLVLETANLTLDEEYARLHPGVSLGEHVVLAVTDTGTGMSEEVKAHVFEPFFTTKGEGKGTGLGLATSYGIVAQAGGHIGIESTPGAGTTMRIVLPLSHAPEAATRAQSRHEVHLGGSETILLVEDDAAVRGTVRRMLQAYGYRVLDAGDPEEALRLLDRHPEPVHLLLTDVVLPQMNGRLLAEQVLALRPQARVLFVTGYTEDVVMQQGMLDRSLALLHKPFLPAALARKVREVLDAEVAPASL